MSNKFSKDSISINLQNYPVQLVYDNDDMCWIASINIRKIDVAGHGETPQEALDCLSINLTLYLEALQEKEYSGKLNMRMPPSLHSQIAMLAQEQGTSINAILIQASEYYIQNLTKQK